MAHVKSVPNETRDKTLEALFGATKDTAHAILDVIESEPARVWQAEDVMDATGFRPMEVMIVLARLASARLVHHKGLGSGYRRINGR